MLVSLAQLPDSVSLTELDEQDGQLVSTNNIAGVHPGERFERIPYDRLRELGDGEHALALHGDCAVVEDGVDERPGTWGWLAATIFFFVIGCVTWWFFADWEANGGRVRIHWAVALAYSLGGKWGAAGLFWVIATGCGAMMPYAAWQAVSMREHNRKKVQHVIEGMLLEEESRVTILANAGEPTERAVWISQNGSELQLFLPMQWLSNEEQKRAEKFLGLPEHVPPNPEPFYTRPAAFCDLLEPDPVAAAERILAVFDNVYDVHPTSELISRQFQIFINEADYEEAMSEPPLYFDDPVAVAT